MSRTLIVIAALCAVMGCRDGQPPKAPEAPEAAKTPEREDSAPRIVVASHGNDRVTLAELQAFLDGFSPDRRAEVAPAEGRRAFLRNYLLYRTALRRAEAAGYGDDPRVRRARDRAMAQHWTEDRVAGTQAPAITDAELRARWEAVRRPERPARVRARHILVADAQTAQAVREALLAALARPGTDAEAAFAAAAQEHSLDEKTRERGGDLLFFSRNGDEVAWHLAPRPVLDAALATRVIGQVSQPIVGRAGVHLLMVTARREAEERGFDDEAEALRGTLARERADAARKALETDLLDMNDWTVDDGALDDLVVAPIPE